MMTPTTMRNQPRYEVCQLDERLANATMNMISGRPDILYTISWHRSPLAALRAQRKHGARIRVRGEKHARIFNGDQFAYSEKTLLKILEEPTDEEKQQQAE